MNQCPKCQRDIPNDESALAKCPQCGELWYHPPPPPSPVLPDLEDQTLAEHRRWRLCFWLCFLLTPVVVWLLALYPNWFKNVVPGSAAKFLQMMAPFGIVGAFGLGTFTASYCLAKLYAKPRTTVGLIVATIAFGLGLTVVYVAVLFVGCLAIFSRSTFL